MCGRYALKNPDAIARLIARLTGEPYELVRGRYNVAPGQINPTVRKVKSEPHKILAEEMKWGHFAQFSPEGPPTFLINARSETAMTKRTFAAGVRQRRCVVPADGFYEWKRDDKGRSKQAYHIQLKDGEPYWMAGIFWEPEGEQPTRYIVFTIAPNALMAPIHDRMPVILRDEEAKLWADPETPIERATGLFRAYPADGMEAYPVSALVNSVANDVPDCVVPVLRGPESPKEEQGALF